MHAISVLSRRDLLRTGGALVVSFMCGAALPQRSLAQASGAGTDLGKPLDLKEVDSFLAVHADGSVTIYTSKVDVGTGLRTAMSQMVAEELGVPVERIAVIEGDTALTPDQGGTGGSTGIPRGAVEVRQAAATARQAILKLGAERLGRLAGTARQGGHRPLCARECGGAHGDAGASRRSCGGAAYGSHTACRHVLVALPEPRFARAVLCSCRCAAGGHDHLDRVTRSPRS